MQYTESYKAPFGQLQIIASQTHLLQINLKHENDKEVDNPNAITQQTKEQLAEYFCNKRAQFTIPVQFNGTTFQKQIWSQIQLVNYGKTKSYQEISRLIDSKAYRAVGSNIGKNPIPIIIPCHRIINSSGKIGGFGWGTQIKKYLLCLEGIVWKK